MKRGEYRAALKVAREEFDVLRGERDALENRIARLRHTIAALEALCDESPTFEEGLTEACRTVLKASIGPLNPIEVRAQLGALGLPMTKYSNPLASVHTVLKRLAQAGEVSVVYGKGKPDAYQWMRVKVLARSAADLTKWIGTMFPHTHTREDEETEE